MLPGSDHSPYYFRDRKWLRGLKPQLTVPPLESLVGKYAWLQTGSYEHIGPKPDHILDLYLKDPNVSESLDNIAGRVAGVSFTAAKKMNDENGAEYWEFQVTGDEDKSTPTNKDPKGRLWRLYVGVQEDDNGFPFVEIQEVNGSQYAYGKRQTVEDIPVELTDAEKERINLLPVSRASLGRSEFQEIKRDAHKKDEDIGDECDDPEKHGSPWYMDEGYLCRGFVPQEIVPPLEALLGRYTWVETAGDQAYGPRLKESITLEVKDSKCEATGTNVGGFLGSLYMGGTILGAKKKKHGTVEYWELEVTGDEADGLEVEEYDSDEENTAYWYMYVSKIVDDNGHPFLEVTTGYDYSGCGPHGPVGYGKRHIPGTKVMGFSELEKKRINFMTEEERFDKEDELDEERQEERRKKDEEAKKMRDAEEKEQDGMIKMVPKAEKEQRPPQPQPRGNGVQPPLSDNKLLSSQQDGRTASSSVQPGSQVDKKNSVKLSKPSTAGNHNNNGGQTSSGQGMSKSARKRANKRKREEEARQQQQRQGQASGVVGYGGVWPPSYFQYPLPQVSNGSRTFGNLPYPVDQRPSIRAEPMATGMVWEGTSSQQNGNKFLKRKHSDDDGSNFKRVKRG